MKRLCLLLLLNIFSVFGQELTTIKVSVPNKEDEVFIVGNQESLGNWQPDKVKMNKTSDYEREISLNLKIPTEFKFTRGNWESEAIVLDYQIGKSIFIANSHSDTKFIIENWKDEKAENGRFTLKYDIKYFFSEYYPNEERTLRIFLPKNYDASKKYPVVYTLDGQSLFNTLIQNISILQDNSFDEGNIIPECIAVAIDNTNRGRDLTPNLGHDSNLLKGTFIKETETFYKILNQEIVPFINKNYSVSGFNAIIGHSDAGHFVTQLYLKQDNAFEGVIALSVNDFNGYFQDQLPKKLDNDTSKLLFLGYGNKDDEFNVLGGYLNKYNMANKNFKVKEYNADHMQLPFTSLFDALKFMFSDYKFYDDLIDKTYDKDFDYKTFENLYVDNIDKKYGVQVEIGYDIYYLLNKAREKNNEYVFNKLLDEIDETGIYQLQLRFYAANEFNQDKRAKNYLHKMLLSDDETDKLIFFANLDDQYFDFYINKLNEPSEFINFVEQAKQKWPEYILEFNYIILKVLVEKKIKSSKKNRYYKHCEQNFKENRYFRMEDLQKLNIK